MTANNSLVKTQTDQLRKYLNAFKPNYQELLGDEKQIGKLMATFEIAYHKFPQLLSCAPYSIAKCAMAAAMTGIYPDGINAHLVPFRTEAVYLVDWKGFAKTMNGSDYIRLIYADVVREGDKDNFHVYRGSNPHIEHTVTDFTGEIIYYYAHIEYADGVKDFEVMTREEVEIVRNNYSAAWKAQKNSPWHISFDEMAKKTVGHRLLKRVPLPDQVQNAVEFDNQATTGKSTEIPGLTQDILPEDMRPPTKTEKLAEKVAGAAETTAEVDDAEKPPEPPDDVSEGIPDDPVTAETLNTLLAVMNEKVADGSLPQEKADAVDESIRNGEMTDTDAEALILRFGKLKPPKTAKEKKAEADLASKAKDLRKQIIMEQERLDSGDFQAQMNRLSEISGKKYVDADNIPDAELEDILKKLKKIKSE